MIGYEYVRAMRSLYNPRTPKAALVAVEAGILPVEAVVYKASSVKPLFEEPYDLDELERVLAQRDLSFGDAMMLAEIFVAMTLEADKERALFAAESMTSLENRWARKVEDLRPGYKQGDEDGAPAFAGAFALARALYEQAMIAGRSAPIRNFYLLEAYYILLQMPEAGSGGPSFGLLIRCLLRLGLLDQAESEVSAELALREDGELVALAVEIAYLKRDVQRIRELLEGRDAAELGLAGELGALLESWRD
jgi:hypothetical protein